MGHQRVKEASLQIQALVHRQTTTTRANVKVISLVCPGVGFGAATPAETNEPKSIGKESIAGSSECGGVSTFSISSSFALKAY